MSTPPVDPEGRWWVYAAVALGTCAVALALTAVGVEVQVTP